MDSLFLLLGVEWFFSLILVRIQSDGKTRKYSINRDFKINPDYNFIF